MSSFCLWISLNHSNYFFNHWFWASYRNQSFCHLMAEEGLGFLLLWQRLAYLKFSGRFQNWYFQGWLLVHSWQSSGKILIVTIRNHGEGYTSIPYLVSRQDSSTWDYSVMSLFLYSFSNTHLQRCLLYMSRITWLDPRHYGCEYDNRILWFIVFVSFTCLVFNSFAFWQGILLLQNCLQANVAR